MKFFKPEDFYTIGELDTRKSPLDACEIANNKLAKKSITIQINQLPGKIYVNKPGIYFVTELEKCKHSSLTVWGNNTIKCSKCEKEFEVKYD